ncbi:hypothetical protein NA57DRAFT_33976 [Rhizodiscina lignyota]|uniref:Major royal jelly protein n=1 Tax=Rhizodiscina lignyota TaxID=1504668 RepID=A0A9P4M8E0_9PEZI|nr:hypothetical protein NA57DRAFT_33976 [Rhizodiscina lignyota]
MLWITLLSFAVTAAAYGYPSQCPKVPEEPDNTKGPRGLCPTDFTIIGPQLEAVHESTNPPTGLAVDNDLNIYITYPRNDAPTPLNVVIATSFTTEEPWPSAEIQNCTAGQDVRDCFINVQNVVLDSIGQMWIVDSGIFPGNKSATPGGAKIISFNITTREKIRTYTVPTPLLTNMTNCNDVRINNTAGTGGFAFLTDESQFGSIIAIDLDTGGVVKRLFNSTFTKSDPGYVGVFDGDLIYKWNNGTSRGFLNTGSDGIALASGNVYWGVLSSRRFYFVSQAILQDFSASDDEVLAAVQDPGQCGTEQAGFTADDKGRVYILASEHNAIFYVDTQQSQVTMEVNGAPPGGSGPVPTENYVVKDLVRNAQIQHADSAAILDGWLYFCTNQLELKPDRQYMNVDRRKGPFRSYRVWIGAGPAV